MGGKGLGSIFSRISNSTSSERDKAADGNGSAPAVFPKLKAKKSESSLGHSSWKETSSRTPPLPGKRKKGFFGAGGQAPALAGPSVEEALGKVFDDLRVFPETEKDALGADAVLSYIQQLEVDPETCGFLVVLDIVQAPNMGEITRTKFVEGWKNAGITPSLAAQKQYVRTQINSLRTDATVYRRVYRYAFDIVREPAERALPFGRASEMWDVMFAPPGRPWVTGSGRSKTDWLALWKQFVREDWKKTVNKDMWSQTFEFALRVMEVGSLDFWSEDSAWASYIDEFIAWHKKKVLEAPAPAAGEAMAVDD